MKKLIVITPVFFVLNSFGQNLIQTNLSNSNWGNQAVQSSQVFASNILVNDNNINKPSRANANPQAVIQRASNANTNQRPQSRRRITPVNTNISNPIQTNVSNVSENNMNDDFQLQGNFSQQADNLGNSFGNENNINMIEQIATANIPAIQLGTSSLNLDLDMNLPKIKLPSIKFSSHRSISGSKHQRFQVKNKLAKLNRKFSGKLSLRKKLKVKVDNCFKW